MRGLGDGAAQELRADPWLLLGLEGVRVDAEHADAFARALLGRRVRSGRRAPGARAGRAPDGEGRARRATPRCPPQELKAALARHAVPDPDRALGTAVEEGQVLVFREERRPARRAGRRTADDGGEDDEDARPNRRAVPLLFGLDRYALAEESLADGCVRLLRSFEGDGGRRWTGTAPRPPRRPRPRRS